MNERAKVTAVDYYKIEKYKTNVEMYIYKE